MKICFVCHANICRSFLSQELLKDLLAKNNITNIEVISRGLYALSYTEVPEKIKKFLLKNKIVYKKHIPTQYSKQDLETSDLILVMTKEQFEDIVDKYAEFSNKIYMLFEYVLDEIKDINDPINLEGKKFDIVANNLKLIVQQLFNKLI